MSEFPNYKYGTGLGNVGSYQVAGKPFASGGLNALENQSDQPISIHFPSVTRWIYVINHDNTRACDVGFSQIGLDGDNYFTIPPAFTGSANAGAPAGTGFSQNSVRLELKVNEIWLTGSTNVDVVAGLTGIDGARINNISPSGSSWSGSIGVG